LGYYMTVEYQDLKANGLSELPREVDELWALENEKVFLIEGFFKWGNWFLHDLSVLAKAGVTGEIELSSESCEWEKFKLENGLVKVYQGRIVYSKEPFYVYKKGDEEDA